MGSIARVRASMRHGPSRAAPPQTSCNNQLFQSPVTQLPRHHHAHPSAPGCPHHTVPPSPAFHTFHTFHTAPRTCVMTTICCPGRCINWCTALSYRGHTVHTCTPHTCVMTTICCPGRCINWCVALSYRGHTVHTCTPHTCVMTTICCPGRCINWCMALSYKRRGELFTHSSPYSWRYGWLSGTNTSPEGREGGGKGVGRRRPVSLNTLQFRIRQAHE